MTEPTSRSSECARPASVQPDGSATTGVYVFFRGEWFYLLHFENDEEAIANAECNPGTTRVADLHGRTVWPNNELRHGGENQ